MYLRPDLAREEFAGELLVVPHATWSADHDAAAERLTFRHEAGDPVPAEELSVVGVGREPVTSFDGVGDAVGPGDAVSVSTADAEAGSTVRLLYSTQDGNGSSTLFSYDLP